jgi:ABC-2 type transport system ATP-binding protein
MIDIDGLTRHFDGVVAVENLTLRIEDGQIFGLLGPNGAGKTTTVRMLACLLRPTRGTAYIDGMEVSRNPDSLHIRQMVGVLPEAPGLYEALSAWANLEFFAKLYDVPPSKREARIRELLQMLGLWEKRDDRVATYSKGMKQKIAIARAVVHEPEYLFLDEPTAGLDPQAAATVRDLILELKGEGRTILLNTHNLDEAERVCDRIGILRTRLLAQGTPEELAARHFGRTTVLHVKSLPADLLDRLQSIPGVRNVRTVDGKVLLDVGDPKATNPAIASTAMEAGAQVQFITELRYGLEEVYMKLMGEAS